MIIKLLQLSVVDPAKPFLNGYRDIIKFKFY